MANTCSIFTVFNQTSIILILKSLIIILTGLVIARFASNGLKKIIAKYASSQQSMLLQKIIYFSILILFLVTGLQQLGFKLSVLLGSAGIATAAVAIASQTSISNIISGIFLIMEKSFRVGDRIKVGSTTGTVLSVDLLSVKVLTANNTMVRIPNESLIKAEFLNLTHFDTLRSDFSFKISSEEDVELVKKIVIDLAAKNPLIIQNPPPSVCIQELDSSGIFLQLSVWSQQKDTEALGDQLYTNILTAFRENNIQL